MCGRRGSRTRQLERREHRSNTIGVAFSHLISRLRLVLEWHDASSAEAFVLKREGSP